MKKEFLKYTVPVACFFFILCTASCEKVIDIDLHSVEPRVVIEALLPLDSTETVGISTTKDFNIDNEFIPLSGAVVTLKDDDGNSEILEQNNEGLYVGRSIKGVEQKTYYLHIDIDGKEYTSESTMPRFVRLEKINMYSIPAFDYPLPQIVFQDPAGEDNYYRAKLYINGTRKDIGGGTVDDEQRDGLQIERLLPAFDDDDDRETILKGDTILVEFQTLDKGAYTFFDTFGTMGMSQNNPASNIEGGALGYFSAYTVDRMKIIADWN